MGSGLGNGQGRSHGPQHEAAIDGADKALHDLMRKDAVLAIERVDPEGKGFAQRVTSPCLSYGSGKTG